jgi:glycine/D-amino acid oxidase-like deaminating enzyme
MLRGEMEADKPSDYATTWFTGATPLPPSQAPLNYDLDVDVCVIGGGLAGLTVAREVARRGWSVAVLEAHRVAWSASGRNSGVVLPGFSAPLEKIVERIGLESSRGLWELSQTGVQYIRDTIADSGKDGIIEGNGWLDVSKWPDKGRISARVSLLAEMGLDAEAWPIERVRDVLRTSHYFDAVWVPGAFQINPLAYALGLSAAALQAGARIFENTPVVAADLAGVRKRIDTPQARVRAGQVVLAGNVHLGSIVRPLAGTLVPVTAHVGVTKPLGKPLAHAVAFGGAVSASRHGNHHYRIVGGDRLLWTGTAAGAMWARKSLQRAISSTYPQLGAVRFDHFWPGQMGFAVHGMPQIGEVWRGVWLASAFGGQGLNTSAMAGALIARAIIEGDDAWKRFLPFELVWAGGRAGRSMARASAWWQRQSEAVVALAARQHEEFQRSQAEKPGAAKLPGAKFPSVKLTIPSCSIVMPALKRVLKGSFTANDRPIDAPETVPGAEAGGSTDKAKRDPARAVRPEG